jgi:hypothetical protein
VVSAGYVDVTLTGHGTKGIQWVRVEYTQIAASPPQLTLSSQMVSSSNDPVNTMERKFLGSALNYHFGYDLRYIPVTLPSIATSQGNSDSAVRIALQ